MSWWRQIATRGRCCRFSSIYSSWISVIVHQHRGRRHRDVTRNPSNTTSTFNFTGNWQIYYKQDCSNSPPPHHYITTILYTILSIIKLLMSISTPSLRRCLQFFSQKIMTLPSIVLSDLNRSSSFDGIFGCDGASDQILRCNAVWNKQLPGLCYSMSPKNKVCIGWIVVFVPIIIFP